MLSKRMLTHTATISRQIKDGHVIRAATYKEGVRGSLQPLTNKAALEYSLIPGKAYGFYTNDTDFKVSDVLSVDGNKYAVRGVNVFNGFGGSDHTMVLLDQAA